MGSTSGSDDWDSWRTFAWQLRTQPITCYEFNSAINSLWSWSTSTFNENSQKKHEKFVTCVDKRKDFYSCERKQKSCKDSKKFFTSSSIFHSSSFDSISSLKLSQSLVNFCKSLVKLSLVRWDSSSWARNWAFCAINCSQLESKLFNFLVNYLVFPLTIFFPRHFAFVRSCRRIHHCSSCREVWHRSMRKRLASSLELLMKSNWFWGKSMAMELMKQLLL